MMHNAPANTETANAVDRLESYSLAEPTPQRSGTARNGEPVCALCRAVLADRARTYYRATTSRDEM
jgi:hypothetical protein